jgi:hypothetical protein
MASHQATRFGLRVQGKTEHSRVLQRGKFVSAQSRSRGSRRSSRSLAVAEFSFAGNTAHHRTLHQVQTSGLTVIPDKQLVRHLRSATPPAVKNDRNTYPCGQVSDSSQAVPTCTRPPRCAEETEVSGFERLEQSAVAHRTMTRRNQQLNIHFLLGQDNHTFRAILPHPGVICLGSDSPPKASH